MTGTRDFYVYVHRDSAGKIFYVGKGTGRRAWSTDRHDVWHRYVKERLNGQYTVEVIYDNVSEQRALELENQLMAQYGPQLVNWINPGRQFDLVASEQYHALRDATRVYVNETRLIENDSPEEAVRRYREALCRVREYESFVLERGLIAELNDGPKWGEPIILDRLTLCLARLGRRAEAVAEAEKYFDEFPGSLHSVIGQCVLKRVHRFKACPTAPAVNRSVAAPRELASYAGGQTPVTAPQSGDIPTGWERVIEHGQEVIRLSRTLKLDRSKHYIDYDTLQQFNRDGKFTAAAALLEQAVIAVEHEAAGEGENAKLAPWYTEQLATVYRKLHRYREECLALERYISHPAAIPLAASRFRIRLVTARRLASGLQELQ